MVINSWLLFLVWQHLSCHQSRPHLPLQIVLQVPPLSTSLVRTQSTVEIFTKAKSVCSLLPHGNQVGCSWWQQHGVDCQGVDMMLHAETKLKTTINTFLHWYLLREKKTPDLIASSLSQAASLTISIWVDSSIVILSITPVVVVLTKIKLWCMKLNKISWLETH